MQDKEIEGGEIGKEAIFEEIIEKNCPQLLTLIFRLRISSEQKANRSRSLLVKRGRPQT